MEVLQSAVRLPTPDPDAPPSRSPEPALPAKRKRSPSPDQPQRRRQMLHDVDPNRTDERERQLAQRLRRRDDDDEPSKPLTDAQKQEKAKEEYQRLLSARSGGTYVPPARLRQLQSQITDKTSKEYQRMAWEALKKSIQGIVNKVNIGSIKLVVPELFNENLVRGRGLFCRSIMKAQAASLPFTPVFATMVAIVNTKLPQVGELLVNRLVSQWKKAYKRNDKTVLRSSTTFIAHLCNQQVVHEMLAAQMLGILLKEPTDDSVEIAVDLTREVGQHLEEMNGPIAMIVFDQFRNILNEADIDKRTQYMIEVLFQVRKERYKDNPAVKEELDLVEEEDQITHQPPALDEPIDTEDGLNIFKFDAEFEEHEEAYRKLKAEILGEADGSDEEYESDEESSDDEAAQKERELEIKDQSNMDLTNLRKTIFLTLMSSSSFEEATHKLMKINLPVGKESELPSMIIESCSQRPTYEKFYGLIGERLAKINRLWQDQFENQFVKYYDTIHRYETNRLRNIARFFGHIMGSEAIGFHVLSVVRLNEEETTSSSRIFIKILFQDLAEIMGMKTLQARFKDESLRASYDGILPTDHPRNTRFAINYFTSIGMGPITEGLREHLKNMPKPAPPALPAAISRDDTDASSVSSYSSYSSYTGSSRSRSRSQSYDSRSRARPRSLSRSRSVSRTPTRRRGRSYTRSISRSRSRSHTPHRRRGRSYTPSISRSRSYSRSVSRRRSPPRSHDRARSYTPSISRSRSRSPRRRRAASIRSPSISPSRPRRRSPSYTPPPRREPARGARGSGHGRGAFSGRGRDNVRSPPGRKRRNSSSAESGDRR